ncbi:FG-GAP repeat domain-containing protein [Dokdonella soli]
MGPTPSFATQQTFATGTLPQSVTVADVNGDGKPDLDVPSAI